MEGPGAAARGNVSLHNFSARLWEQLVHFHVMRLTDSLFLWVGATPHLRNLSVAMCTRYVSAAGGPWDPIPVSTALLGDMSDTTSTGLAQRLVVSMVLSASSPGSGDVSVSRSGTHACGQSSHALVEALPVRRGPGLAQVAHRSHETGQRPGGCVSGTSTTLVL
ncbi:proteasome assembly chaperone 4 isoform X3 [Orcinus orca]|uniref:proteasome assembly chaperone 4 isoform X3 n=1 Tax=Orcinus orca TaxID=9733 RepID=UPI0014419420|nr:proteasome assembly chaperone 4 isoform X3 [Orcinus orca]